MMEKLFGAALVAAAIFTLVYIDFNGTDFLKIKLPEEAASFFFKKPEWLTANAPQQTATSTSVAQ